MSTGVIAPNHLYIEIPVFTNYFLFTSPNIPLELGHYTDLVILHATDFYFKMIKGTLQDTCHIKGKFSRES